MHCIKCYIQNMYNEIKKIFAKCKNEITQHHDPNYKLH